VHEFYAAAHADGACLAVLAMMLGEAPGKGVRLWVRHEAQARETGAPFAAGIAELGLAPERLPLVLARDAASVLQAALEGARCAALEAVIAEIWGEATTLDLTATRRLALGGEASGAQVFLLRVGARLLNPTAAYTRWRVTPAPSRALAARAPGAPAFLARLERHRGGWPEQTFYLEWDRDARELRHADAGSSLSRAVAALSLGRNPPQPQPIQRAG